MTFFQVKAETDRQPAVCPDSGICRRPQGVFSVVDRTLVCLPRGRVTVTTPRTTMSYVGRTSLDSRWRLVVLTTVHVDDDRLLWRSNFVVTERRHVALRHVVRLSVCHMRVNSNWLLMTVMCVGDSPTTRNISHITVDVHIDVDEVLSSHHHVTVPSLHPRYAIVYDVVVYS